MKISVDDKELFTLTELQKKTICNDIDISIFEADMKRRLQYILHHKYEKCFERLKSEWLPKLKNRVTSLPTDDNELLTIIFSQEDYKDRSKKDLDEERQRISNV